MQSSFRLVVLASLAISAAATAQTPPADQNQSQLPSQNPPGQTNPTDPSTTPGAQTGAPEQAGVPGEPSGGRQKAGEEIVVTGSRVRRKDLTTPAPVTVISREQISASGITAIGDFLFQMPEQGGATNTNVNNAGTGETAVSLRNLGAQRTLVLVDGKRWVNGGSTGSGLSTAVDLNSIPTNVIDRVEVLKDGASAVYGSDAIGGVVNIITRRRVNGVEANAYYGMSQHSDAQQTDLNLLGGAAGDKGSFMFSAGYFNQASMLAGNRDWAKSALIYDYSASPGPDQITTGGSGTIPSGRVRVALDDSSCATNPLCSALQSHYGSSGNVYFIPLGTASALPTCSGTVAKANFLSCQVKDPRNGEGWRPYVSSGAVNDLYNYQSVNYLVTPSQRISLFSNGDFHVSDFARAYFQGSVVNRQSSVQLAAEPLITSQFGAAVSKDNPFNPFGQDILDVRRRLLENSQRSQSWDSTTARVVAGVDGTLPTELGPLQGVFWDLSFNYGRVSGTTTNAGSVNTLDVANGLGASCPASAANCVPVNLFGGAPSEAVGNSATSGTITPAMVTALGGYRGVQTAFTQLISAQANVSAELFQLMSSKPVGLAAGYEYRQHYGGFTPDPIGQAGLSFDYNANPTRGSFHVNEGYAELDVPVISNVPFAEDVEVQAAVRGYDYSTFGGGATYKFGARWTPIRDVTLRGTFSTGFRAPDIPDLYGGSGPSAEPATDPCASATGVVGARCNAKAAVQGAGGKTIAGNGDTSVQINSTIGGNPNLRPEKAYIGTAGIVLEPRIVRNFSATVDWYNIKVTQNIGAITAPVILNGCYLGGNDAYCALITRDPATGFISNVQDLQTNVGTTQTSGIDLALRYALPVEGIGRFGFLFDSNYLIYYRQTLGGPISASLSQVISAAGNYDLGSGSALSNLTPRIKFNAGVNYSLAGFNAGVRGRYIGGFNECAGADGSSLSAGLCSNPSPPVDADGNPVPGGTPYAPHHVPAYVAFDVFASYLLHSPIGNTTLAVGVRNLLNNDPPRVFNAFLSYADPAYDFVGRFVYGRITQTF